MSSHNLNSETRKPKPTRFKPGVLGLLILGGVGAYYYVNYIKKPR